MQNNCFKINIYFITRNINHKLLLGISTLSYSTPEFKPKEILGFQAKSMQNYSGNTDLSLSDIENVFIEYVFLVFQECDFYGQNIYIWFDCFR